MRKRYNYNPLFCLHNINDFKYLFNILTNKQFDDNLPNNLYLFEILTIIAENNKN